MRKTLIKNKYFILAAILVLFVAYYLFVEIPADRKAEEERDAEAELKTEQCIEVYKKRFAAIDTRNHSFNQMKVFMDARDNEIDNCFRLYSK